jgi:hypothetical protein
MLCSAQNTTICLSCLCLICRSHIIEEEQLKSGLNFHEAGLSGIHKVESG